MLEILYHRAKFGGARISPAAGVAKNVEFFCLSVCLFATLLNVRDCPPDSAMKALEYRNDFDILDRGRFVVAHPCSTFSDYCQLATPLNAEVQKTPKNGKHCCFSPPQDDRINRSRRNFADKCRPWVCCSTPNLAVIAKRESIQEPPKMSTFVQNCGFCPLEADTMNTFR